MGAPSRSLAQIAERAVCLIAGYDETLPASRRERFEDLGLLVGASVRRLYTAPLGDPIAFEVRGSVLCLRREDACRIRIGGAEK